MENRFNLSISSRVRPSGFIPGKPLLWLPHGFILNLNTFKRPPQNDYFITGGLNRGKCVALLVALMIAASYMDAFRARVSSSSGPRGAVNNPIWLLRNISNPTQKVRLEITHQCDD